MVEDHEEPQKSPTTAGSSRRPKPTNFGERRTLRLDEECERAVDAVWSELAKQRGYDPKALRAKQAEGRKRRNDDGKAAPRRPESGEPTCAEALRILLVRNFKAAQILAGEPEAWPKAETIDMPDEYWDLLTTTKNEVSYARASMYVVLRDKNFKNAVNPATVKAGFEAIAALKSRVADLERVLDYLVADSGSNGHSPDGEDAEAA